MKIAVIGGAGVRAPLLVGSLAKRRGAIPISEVAIYDIDPRKTKILVPLAKRLLEKAGSPFKLTAAATPEDAVRGAHAIITTIRQGFEEGRARDERFCLNQNVIGQETTGPAGFAFACRSIPALLGYARTIFDLNPDAWLINFTNPAGMVTEALLKSGFDRVIGVCDSADLGRHFAADHLGVEGSRVTSLVAGLNHLSFTTSVKVDGEEKLSSLLMDNAFLARAQAVFPAGLVRRLGSYLNEYLYYFFLRDAALAAMRAEAECRGEKILKWNHELLSQLEPLTDREDYDTALDNYFAYQRRRNASYMDYAREGENLLPTSDEEGYAGVALDFLEALGQQTPRRHALCTANQGAMNFLADEDIVEITCEIGNGRVRPVQAMGLPTEGVELIREMKRYENLAVQAILNHSVEAAVAALAAHPLVPDPALAARLFEGFRASEPKVFEAYQ